MGHTRRAFFKRAGVLATGLTIADDVIAKDGLDNAPTDQRMGVLVDTTYCIGCRRCEYHCKVAHGIPTDPEDAYDNRAVFSDLRRPSASALTVVNEFHPPGATGGAANVKVQCMHCDHPACVSACIVGAFSKQSNGAVVWDESKCIGCRYCLIACPFQVPAFEYQKAIQPRIMKCDFCADRTKLGQQPACVEGCPVEAMTYGKRYELVKLAHSRIADHPERYVDHVYGEHEAGGTSWLYLASSEFVDLALPALSDNPAPGASEAVQHGIFKYFIPPISLFALLGGIMFLGRDQSDDESGD